MHTLAAIILLVVHAATLSVPLVLVITRTTMRGMARAAALGKVPEHNLTTLRFTKEAYAVALRDEGKEIFTQGVMHDIVRVTFQSDTAVVLCVRDNAETAIHAAINNEQNNAMGRDGRVQHLVRLMLAQQAAILLPNTTSELPSGFITILHHHPDACRTMSGEPLVPPPRWDS